LSNDDENNHQPPTPTQIQHDHHDTPDPTTHSVQHHTDNTIWGEASNPGPSVKTEFLQPVQNLYRNDLNSQDVRRRNQENNDPIIIDEESEEEAAEITNIIHDLRHPTNDEMQQAIDEFQQSMDQHQEEVQCLMNTKFQHLPMNDPQPTRRYASNAHAPPTLHQQRQESHACHLDVATRTRNPAHGRDRHPGAQIHSNHNNTDHHRRFPQMAQTGKVLPRCQLFQQNSITVQLLDLRGM
jgi:hypothetical protein